MIYSFLCDSLDLILKYIVRFDTIRSLAGIIIVHPNSNCFILLYKATHEFQCREYIVVALYAQKSCVRLLSSWNF